MAKSPNKEKSNEWQPRYWLVFGIGIIYIVLLGLFTFLFNNPA